MFSFTEGTPAYDPKEMIYAPLESREGLYDIYYTPEGERYVVLEGLSVEDVPVTYPIQTFMHTHYETISLMYWILYAATLTFLITKFLAIPLVRKWKGIPEPQM